MVEVHTSGDPLGEAAHTLQALLETYKEKDVLLLFSGGSALAIVDHTYPKNLSSHHTLSVLDERYTFEEEESNFAKLTHTAFFKESQACGSHFIDPRPHKNEHLQDAAKRFDIALKKWHLLHHDGVVIVTAGVGPDGHTSGILPMPEKKDEFKRIFFNIERCATGYETTPDKNPHTKRITTTCTYLLRHVTHAIIYATGKPKKEVLERMLQATEETASLPSIVLNGISDARLYTDMSLGSN